MSTSNRPKTAWTMLFRVVDRLRAKSARNVSIPNMKITLGKIRIINYLFVREGEPPMLKEIAETFGLTSGAVSQTVDALAADGVVERIPSAVDRRSVHITLTPFGLSIRKQLESYLTDVMSGILDDVPEDKQEAFMEVLQDMSCRKHSWRSCRTCPRRSPRPSGSRARRSSAEDRPPGRLSRFVPIRETALPRWRSRFFVDSRKG